jgi:hypothetical protein
VNKQLRDEWVKALRSGKYDQTTETLEKDGAYCCLGVLCVVAGQDIPDDANDLDSYEYESGEDDEDEILLFDMRPFRDQCGLGTAPDSLQNKLVKMNDDENKTFAEIADWIEQNVPAESPEQTDGVR